MSTKKEDPHGATSISHKLLVRGGYIYPFSAGIYAYLPLMWRVLRKIEQIIREEMDKCGGIELNLPILQPRTIWEEAGRWYDYTKAKFLFHLKDRRGEEFCLAPTAEEAMVDLVRTHLKSYRDLPLLLYQIGSKFRDELRPRNGIIRTREFIMKDGYSFHTDEADMRKTFNLIKNTYQSIFDRCGINVQTVDADSGNIGGAYSSEFMILTNTGEDVILNCESCHYGANIEKANSILDLPTFQKPKEFTKIYTPNIKTIEQLSSFLANTPADKILKTVIYQVDDQLIVILIRGDLEINERKLEEILTASYFVPANVDTIVRFTGADVGFTGPIGLSGATIIADESVQTMLNFVCGANETNYHFINVNFGRDLPWPERFINVRNAREGDICPNCQKNRLKVDRGIELGHIFQLDSKYSKPMKLTYKDNKGQYQLVLMGCYGIGISRMVAGVIEQLHDKHGIVWPEAIAPYRLIITPISWENSVQRELAEKIYQSLQNVGEEVILDDRDESAGFKFKDADLLGIPWRITIGQKANDGLVEVKNRKTGQTVIVPFEQILQTLKNT